MAHSFSIRSYQRFPLGTRVYYRGHGVVGNGTVWNISHSGWRIDGDASVFPGDRLSLCVYLPWRQGLVMVDQAVVRWSRGQEFGLENLELEEDNRSRLQGLVTRLVRKRSYRRVGRSDSPDTPAP